MRKSPELPEPKDGIEAAGFILHGLVFFLTNHLKKTLIALAILVILCGGAIYTVIDLMKTRYSIEEIKPTEAKPQ